MKMLISGATRLLAQHAGSSLLGGLLTPRTRNSPDWYAAHGFAYAADNDAYSNFDAARYTAMLERLERAEHPPLWIVAPDVVADADATAARYTQWRDRLTGLPVAYVAQDGVNPAAIPWQEIACVFIGGTDAFKLGSPARAVTEHAHAEGIPVHLGRVNTRRRIAYARALGAATFDGSAISRWPDSRAPRMLAELRQTSLDEGEAASWY